MTKNIIRELRDLAPLRPLSVAEAIRTADLQATRLLALVGIEEGPVPESAITTLPRIRVERMTPALVSGSVKWARGHWVIIINGAESWGRQRFTIAHEFKHVLDAPFIKFLYPGRKGESTSDRAEQICEYFAGCLLMPRAWVKRAYCDEGIQDLRRLARQFAVSISAMHFRLIQLGLAEPLPSCGTCVARTKQRSARPSLTAR